MKPKDARFFLLECPASPVVANPDLHYMTHSSCNYLQFMKSCERRLCVVVLSRLFYYSGWHLPHVHFRIDGVWTESPGWPLRKSEKPSARGRLYMMCMRYMMCMNMVYEKCVCVCVLFCFVLFCFVLFCFVCFVCFVCLSRYRMVQNGTEWYGMVQKGTERYCIARVNKFCRPCGVSGCPEWISVFCLKCKGRLAQLASCASLRACACRVSCQLAQMQTFVLM